MTTIYTSISGYSPPTKTGPIAPTKENMPAGSTSGGADAYVDVVSISAQGKLLSQMLAGVQRYTPILESDVGLDRNAGPSFCLDLYSQDKINAASAHSSPIAWALGLDAVESPLTFGVDKAQLTAEIQATSESLDAGIADALQSAKITLGKNEKLKLSVNNKGEIKVADGAMGKARAEEIQKALNQDSSIGRDMLLSHAQRRIMNTGVKTTEGLPNSSAILLDRLLQREYGVSLSDFTFNTDLSDGTGGYSIRCRSRGDDFVASLFDNERALYHQVESYINQVHNDPESANFEYGFSYSNGILVENGETDASGLNEQSRNILNRAFPPSLIDSMDFSVELDSEGNYLRSRVNQVKGGDTNAASQLSRRLMDYFSKPESRLNNLTTGAKGVTKLFSFDSMRLLRYRLGTEAEGLSDFKTVIAGSIK